MDASAIASLATAAGTLVLAVATFSATRSANRAARVAERSFLAAQRPLLFTAHADDPPQKVGFADGHWLTLRDGLAAVDVGAEAIYLAFPLRNPAAGIAVLHGWQLAPRRLTSADGASALEDFRLLSRDLYVPAGEIGFWQGALRDPAEPLFAETRSAIERRSILTVDVLYGDHEGGQRTISRFSLAPRINHDTDQLVGWACAVVRHSNLDRPDPR